MCIYMYIHLYCVHTHTDLQEYIIRDRVCSEYTHIYIISTWTDYTYKNSQRSRVQANNVKKNTNTIGESIK